MQVVALDSARKKKSTHKEVDEWVRVGVGEFGIAENSGSAKQDEGKQRGDSKRQHLGEPPEEHPKGGSEDHVLLGRKASELDSQKAQRAKK